MSEGVKAVRYRGLAQVIQGILMERGGKCHGVMEERCTGQLERPQKWRLAKMFLTV